MALNPNIGWHPPTRTRQPATGPQAQYRWPSEVRILISRYEADTGPMIWLRLPAPEADADLGRYVLSSLAANLAGEQHPREYERRASIAIWLIVGGCLLLGLVIAVLSALMQLAPAIESDDSVPDALRGLQTAVANTSAGDTFLWALLLSLPLLFAGFWKLISSSVRGLGYARASARETLRQLQFEETASAEKGLDLTVGRVGGALRRHRTTRRRELAIHDVYHAAEVLIDRYRYATGKRVILLIDELDRYAVGSDGRGPLGAALNQIKPFLAIRGLSAVMTVSDQAKAAFERRDVTLLTELDSTFDEIIPVPPWDAEDIKELFDYWVVGLSGDVQDQLAKLAGGRPREAIRIARMYVKLRGGKAPLEMWSADWAGGYRALESEAAEFKRSAADAARAESTNVGAGEAVCEYLDLSGPLSIGFQGRSISCFGAIG